MYLLAFTGDICSGDYGIFIFILFLAENSSLQELDLSWNHIRMRGAVGLSAGLKVRVYS